MRALTFLLLAAFISTAQNVSPSSPAASAEQSFVPPFYWSQQGDVRKWLKDHESFLRRGDGCQLNVSWAGTGPYSSALHSIAMFMIAPGDDFDEIFTLIHDDASPSGLDIRVGARYFPDRVLEIALAFEGQPEDVFNEATSAEARSLRDSKWKSVTLLRQIEIGDLRYQYSLSCENGKTFMSFLRKPVKHRAHSAFPITGSPDHAITRSSVNLAYNKVLK